MTLSPAAFIAEKRDGRAHAVEDIEAWIDAYARDQLPDYQMAAWAMAVYLQGMTDEETAALTGSMLRSGTVFQWHDDGRPVVDKHSTGGIGDKVSLLLAPLLACCDVRVPMISGRGLGPTGGTLDKLESISGFQTQLSNQRLQQVVGEVGCVIAGASEDVAPADKRLYALRDVTATVASIPLITGSIMSKKLAEGLDALVLDVKCGSGAFMKTHERARQLARSLVGTGAAMNVATTALVTDMNQPLGRWIGNAVEVDETVAALEGGGPEDLVQLTLQLGAAVLVSARAAADVERATARLQSALDSGAARERLAKMVSAQGGDLDAERPLAPAVEVAAERDGVVAAVDTEQLGWAVIELGGGRRAKGDAIDFGVGIEMRVRLGDRVSRGQPIAVVLGRNDADRQAAAARLHSAITLGEDPVAAPPLILQRIDSMG